MNADTFFAGGTGHKVCQDYARCGKLPDGRAYAIVSDGCSSSPDTDFGARVLVLAAEHALDPVRSGPVDPLNIIENADTVIRPNMILSAVPRTCLDATLLMAREALDVVDVWVAGDGAVVARRRDGKFTLTDFDCAGAPAYLSYLLDDERREAWKTQFGKRTMKKILQEAENYQIHQQFEDRPFNDPAVYKFCLSQEEYDLVMLLTDGIHSFRHRDTLEPIPAITVVEHLMNFKSMNGEFVTRRVRKFLTKECPELGWTHYDDLGVAAIHFGPWEKWKDGL
jgi:hypothetical protein